MNPFVLSCPNVGHKTFEKNLRNITIGSVVTPQQISKFIRPATCITDDMGMTFAKGELQKVDILDAAGLFAYWPFVVNALNQHTKLFAHSECRVYQFQSVTNTGSPFVFGMIVTDGNNNLIDFCIDTVQAHKRRPVLVGLIRAICTPASVAYRISH